MKKEDSLSNEDNSAYCANLGRQKAFHLGELVPFFFTLPYLKRKIEKWSSRAKWGQMVPNRSKRGQMGSNGANWGHIGPNRAKRANRAKQDKMGLIFCMHTVGLLKSQ